MLKDVQGQVDQRHIALKQVGIRDIRWPITLKDPHKGVQHSVAVISLGVNLPHEQRGTHMSRFVECLKEMGPIHPHDLEIVLDGLKEKLGAKKAMLDMRFPYFIEKKAPVSGKTGYLDISCHYHAEKGETFHLDAVSYTHLKKHPSSSTTHQACLVDIPALVRLVDIKEIELQGKKS